MKFDSRRKSFLFIMLFDKRNAEKFDVSPEPSRSPSADRWHGGREQEYPRGVRLVIVVVALVLSVFLVSLITLH